jgi:phosphohistidine phosphatase SixA
LFFVAAPNKRAAAHCMAIAIAMAMAMATLHATTAQAQPSLVVVVRHAEPAASASDDDPGLSPEGTQRAQVLTSHLANAKITSIVTTQLRRTQETARPTAMKFGIQPQVVAVRRGEAPAHVADVVAAVRQLTGVVLVVGHSNTVPAIVTALSGAAQLPLCHTSHANIFVLSMQPTANPVLHFRFGQPDPAPSSACL